MSHSKRVSRLVSPPASSFAPTLLWVMVLYAAITACLYGWTLHFPMVFDDVTYLRDNPLFKADSFGYPWRFTEFATWPQRNGLDPDLAVNFILRPFAYATFCLNSLVSGFEPWSYRLVNLVVHWVNAVLLYQILTLVRRQCQAQAGKLLPLLVGLLFLVHPLAVESVTYIAQRFTSLAAALGLMVICLYLLAREQTGSNLYRSVLRTAAMAAMVLGMLTKECSVVVPLLVLLLEWLVMGSSLRDSLRSCGHLLLTLPIIPALVLLTSAVQNGGGLDVAAGLNIVNSRDVPFQHLHYLLTQTTVVAHYLRLVLWPSGLNLDPEWLLYTSLFAPPVLLAVMIHVGLVTLAVLCWRRWAGDFRAGLCLLGVLWFYLAISVSSGLVPLPDLVAEHRSYLASAGFILALVAGFDLLFEAYGVKRTALALPLVAGLGLATATVQRNRDWSSEVSLWSDTVEKSPGKYRPWNNLGAAYSERREELRALECFQRAQALEPRFAMSALNTSNSLLRLKRPTEALESLDSLLEVNQSVADDFAVRYTQGLGLYAMGNYPAALEKLTPLVQQKPNDLNLRKLLARIHLRQGDRSAALVHYRKALELAPGDAKIRASVEKLEGTSGGQP